MKSVVLLLCCLAATSFGQDVSWERRLRAYNGQIVSVKESATVVDTDSQQTILMTATDENLRGTNFYRAESFHDFKANIVALKPVGSMTCFLTVPRRSFAATRREIRRRVAGGTPRSSLSNLALEDGTELDTSGNDLLDKFCSGMKFVKLTRTRTGPTTVFPPHYPPIWCLWGPIWIWIKIDISITTFVGGFGFFP